MSELDVLYTQLLHHGLQILKEAIYSGDEGWARAEVEMLHNLPSLIGEENAKRHQYYWLQERSAYVDLVNTHGSEAAKSKMRIFYAPIWQEMEPIMLELAD